MLHFIVLKSIFVCPLTAFYPLSCAVVIGYLLVIGLMPAYTTGIKLTHSCQEEDMLDLANLQVPCGDAV